MGGAVHSSSFGCSLFLNLQIAREKNCSAVGRDVLYNGVCLDINITHLAFD